MEPIIVNRLRLLLLGFRLQTDREFRSSTPRTKQRNRRPLHSGDLALQSIKYKSWAKSTLQSVVQFGAFVG